jgi:hypothetical protein
MFCSSTTYTCSDKYESFTSNFQVCNCTMYSLYDSCTVHLSLWNWQKIYLYTRVAIWARWQHTPGWYTVYRNILHTYYIFGISPSSFPPLSSPPSASSFKGTAAWDSFLAYTGPFRLERKYLEFFCTELIGRIRRMRPIYVVMRPLLRRRMHFYF